MTGRDQRLKWATAARTARERTNLGLTHTIAVETGLARDVIRDIEAARPTDRADRETLSRYLFASPRVLLRADEAKASARASGRSFDSWAEENRRYPAHRNLPQSG